MFMYRRDNDLMDIFRSAISMWIYGRVSVDVITTMPWLATSAALLYQVCLLSQCTFMNLDTLIGICD